MSPETRGLTGPATQRPLTAYVAAGPGAAGAYQRQPFGLH